MFDIQNFPDNVMYEGDNLPFLRGMNSETIDLIATDPPFNKKRNRAGTAGQYEDAWRWADHPSMRKIRPDQWKWQPVHREWLEEIKDDNPALYSVIESTRLTQDDDTAAFLCFLGVCLLEMRRVLKSTGSIYLHCDHTANGYIRQTMDAIFGKDNFRNEIVWRIGWVSGYKTQKKGWIRNHDTIYYYTKTEQAVRGFNKEYIPYPPDYVRRDGKKPTGKGVPMEDTWNCNSVDVLNSIMIMSFSTEKTGSPDQKPLALYERIIKASSNEGDIVLAPFAGCATTPIAAHRLGRRWVGMDRRSDGYEHILNRLRQNGIMVDDDHDWQAPLLFDGAVLSQHSMEPPVRTDEGDEAAPELVLRVQRVKAKWELLTHGQMRDILAEAQISNGQVVCAGCGIVLPLRYMELDHREPRKDGGANTIDNRVLLCGPCNRTKRENLTLSRLTRHNQREGYIVSKERAELAASKARDTAERCKVEII